MAPLSTSPVGSVRTGTRRTFLGGLLVALPGVALAASNGPAGAARASRCNRDADDPGLIGDDAWAGPTFGLVVSWEPVRWSVGERSNPYVADAMDREDRPIDCGFGQGGSDRLTLVNGMWTSGVCLIESYDRLMWTPSSMEEAMTQPGWVRNLRVAAGSPLLLAERAGDTLAAVAADDAVPGHTVYWQATFPEGDEDVIHELTLHMWEEGAVYALHDLEGIAIDGIDPFAVVDLDTVRGAIDAAFG
ncbi:MAG TPA: hypothetical protein VNP95_08155 [Thermomicrobiales bacterium]|nr:hypothetical protein [Thermomicrobiales bacterium]